MSQLFHLAALFLTLFGLALVSRVGGRPLLIALTTLAVGIGSVNILIEAFAFSVTDARQTLTAFAFDAPMLAALAIIAGLLSDRVTKRGDSRLGSPRREVLRLAAAPVGYLILYFVAGALAYPYVHDFYAGKALPSPGQLALLQLARGAIFVAASWSFVSLRPRWSPVALGAAFSILGGLAPLMMENAFMPADVRLVHAVEVGISNFLFGMLVAVLLRPRSEARDAGPAQGTSASPPR